MKQKEGARGFGFGQAAAEGRLDRSRRPAARLSCGGGVAMVIGWCGWV